MTTRGFLGIDAGTQGLSIVFTDEQLNVLAVGEGQYEMIPGLGEGCYEQAPADWETAIQTAMNQLRDRLSAADIHFDVLCIGISGQMHGEVLADAKGNSLGPARLWCDSRNETEEQELTERLGVKMPKRITSARWLWTTRNRPELASRAAHLTTPGGWIAFRLTGQWNLGIGDAAGMFPIDQSTLDYDQAQLNSFAALVDEDRFAPLGQLLPSVKRAGESGGVLDANGAALLGLPEGIPVAPAEGDQPAAMTGSLIGRAGMVSVSFGTSVCANSVGDRPFKGVNGAVDHFCAADGKPINMVWLRNGTTYMNSIIGMFSQLLDGDMEEAFRRIMPQVLAAPPDCGGILALPFIDDEPGLSVRRGGTALLAGLNPENANPGNTVKAALLATLFNLRLGSEALDRQGFPRAKIVLSGGLTRTPELGQILADVFDTPVSLLESADEGSAWGAAVLAKYRQLSLSGQTIDWADFLDGLAREPETGFSPRSEQVTAYNQVYARYRKLISLQPELDRAL